MDAEALKRTVKVCMFDQYGTVVDMQGGLVEIATPFLEAKGWGGKPNSFVTWWRRTHFENSMIDALLHKEDTPYRVIGERAVSFVMERSGIKHTAAEAAGLVAGDREAAVLPEVPAALARLQARYRLVVLQWGPGHAGGGEGVPWGAVRPGDLGGGGRVVQAACGDLYRAAELAGVRMDEVLFVANHAFDCIGRRRRGCGRRSSTGGTAVRGDAASAGHPGASMTALADMMT